MHTAQNALIRKIVGMDGNQQGSIGISPCPVRITHAIGDHTTVFGSGCHHITAGAHTEGIHRAILQMLHQFIICRGQRRMLTTVLGYIDDALLMLDTNTHGEGLGFHGNSLLIEHGKGIPGAVTDGQYCLVTFDDTAILQFQTGETAILRKDIDHLAVELHHPVQ